MASIHHEAYGSGQEIIICNGLSQSTANWRGLARQNQAFRWTLYDARGHGKSSHGEEPYTLDGHVADLLHVKAVCAVEKPVLLGFSHGGRVALRAAAEYPEHFAALVLVSVGATVSAKRNAYTQSWANCLRLGGIQALAWSSLPAIVGRKILERYTDLDMLVKGTVARNQEAGLKATFAGMLDYPPPREDAQRIGLPALIMRGGEDPLVLQEDLTQFRQWMPDVRTETFADCGHTLALEEPERFMAVLTAFIQDQIPG